MCAVHAHIIFSLLFLSDTFEKYIVTAFTYFSSRTFKAQKIDTFFSTMFDPCVSSMQI